MKRSSSIRLLLFCFAFTFIFPLLSLEKYRSHAAPLTQIGQDNIRAVAIDPFTPTTLYVGTNRGIMKSLDGGVSWRRMNRGLVQDGGADLAASSIVIDPHFPSTVYAITHPPQSVAGPLYKSMDGGANWTLLLNAALRSVAINPANSSILLAGGSGPDIARFYRSVNGGMTWSTQDRGSLNEAVENLTFHPAAMSTVYARTTGRDKIFKSTNAGVSWDQQGLEWYPDRITSLALHPEDPSILYVTVHVDPISGPTDAMKLTDSGRRGQSFGLSGSLIISDPLRASTLYLVTLTNRFTTALFKSTNDGLTWENTGFPSLTTTIKTVVIDRMAEATLYAGTSSGLLKSTDGGSNWVGLNGIDSMQITGARIEGKRIIITGKGFDRESSVVVDGERQKTLIDEENPTTVIIAKKAGKRVAPGQTIRIQVVDSEGAISMSFLFTRPIN